MERICDACGESYLAKRATSRYCSDRCRKRALRARAAEVVAIDPGKKRRTRSRKPPPPADEPSVAAATKTDLAAVGRLAGPLGQAAMVLAGRIDAHRDTGSALAAVTKEWRATMSAATAGVKREANPLDELRERREARRRGSA